MASRSASTTDFYAVQGNRLARLLVFGEGVTCGGEVFGIFASFQFREVFNQRNNARRALVRKSLQFCHGIGDFGQKAEF